MYENAGVGLHGYIFAIMFPLIHSDAGVYIQRFGSLVIFVPACVSHGVSIKHVSVFCHDTNYENPGVILRSISRTLIHDSEGRPQDMRVQI